MGKEAQTMETVIHFMEHAAGAFAVAQEAARDLSDAWSLSRLGYTPHQRQFLAPFFLEAMSASSSGLDISHDMMKGSHQMTTPEGHGWISFNTNSSDVMIAGLPNEELCKKALLEEGPHPMYFLLENLTAEDLVPDEVVARILRITGAQLKPATEGIKRLSNIPIVNKSRMVSASYTCGYLDPDSKQDVFMRRGTGESVIWRKVSKKKIFPEVNFEIYGRRVNIDSDSSRLSQQGHRFRKFSFGGSST